MPNAVNKKIKVTCQTEDCSEVGKEYTVPKYTRLSTVLFAPVVSPNEYVCGVCEVQMNQEEVDG